MRNFVIDSHIHLDADQYAEVGGLIKRAREAGVSAVIAPGITPSSNRRVMELARHHPNFVHAAIGFHPERYELTNADLEETLSMARTYRDRICAIGEVGLPYYGESARRKDIIERGHQILERFARLAGELDLPLILHSPHEAADDALRLILGAKVRRAVFHWHKSNETTTQAILEAGYFISLTPEIVYRDRDQALAKIVPLGQMMVETDGPWSYHGPFEGKPTEPNLIADVISAIARIKGDSVDAIVDALTLNAKSLFGIAA
jgi:TatD DNase family protein